jgi:malate synthase
MSNAVNRVELSSYPTADFAHILTPDALEFLADLHARFNERRLELLSQRVSRQERIVAGERPDFLAETAAVRAGDWCIAPVPPALQDRRVEITGPVERKMVINALNSGAKVFMADFEDSHAPVWQSTLEGQVNLFDAVRRTIEFTNAKGKHYTLGDAPATLMVRPRGWHLPERHAKVDGQEMSGSLFDFGLFFFHNAHEQVKRGAGPFFYLPKLESHLEARLWNDVFVYAQERLNLPRGTIKATVLIETILAAFEMDEILHELKDHSAGLNCGRWDYIFSFIKKFSADPAFVLPDRGLVGMGVHFMRSYSKLLIQTCHKRGAHAMGGMAAQIPIKNDAAANDEAMAKVRIDKEREAGDGHDGTWVAHPGLVPIALEIFDKYMPEANQLGKSPQGDISAEDLLRVPTGEKTEAGLRQNLSVGVQYLAAWLSGNGCVPLYHLMEDAATAEISRSQVWQWLRHGAQLDDGRTVTLDFVRTILQEEIAKIDAARYSSGKLELAAKLFDEMFSAGTFTSFLTIPAYAHLD